MKKSLFLFIVFLSLFGRGFAQIRSVTGTVTSVEDGQSLPGVTVQVKGTTSGTVTDIEGKFKLTEVTPESISSFQFCWI